MHQPVNSDIQEALLVTLARYIPVEVTRNRLDDIVIQTNSLDICRGLLIDIPRELWGEIGPRISCIRFLDKCKSLLVITVPLGLKSYQTLWNIRKISISISASAVSTASGSDVYIIQYCRISKLSRRLLGQEQPPTRPQRYGNTKRMALMTSNERYFY